MARCTRNQHLHCVLHGLTLCSVTSRWHRSFAASIWNRQLRVCSKQFEVLQGDVEVTRFTCSECPESVFALCFARLDAPQGGLKVTRCTCHQCPESALAMYSTRPEALQGDLMVTQFICSRCLESAFSVRFQRFAAQGRWRAAACPHSTACCVSGEMLRTSLHFRCICYSASSHQFDTGRRSRQEIRGRGSWQKGNRPRPPAEGQQRPLAEGGRRFWSAQQFVEAFSQAAARCLYYTCLFQGSEADAGSNLRCRNQS